MPEKCDGFLIFRNALFRKQLPPKALSEGKISRQRVKTLRCQTAH